MQVSVCCVCAQPDLFERRELRTMSESSMREIHSEVSSPLSSSSPLVLKLLKARLLVLQSATTCFSLVSMSLSLTALTQISYTVKWGLALQWRLAETESMLSASAPLEKSLTGMYRCTYVDSNTVCTHVCITVNCKLICTYVIYLDVILVLQKWCFHDIPEQEGLWFHVKLASGEFLHPLPVPLLHGWVGHHLQKGTGLVEVINLLLQVIERLPLLQGFG